MPSFPSMILRMNIFGNTSACMNSVHFVSFLYCQKTKVTSILDFRVSYNQRNTLNNAGHCWACIHSNSMKSHEDNSVTEKKYYLKIYNLTKGGGRVEASNFH